MDVPARVTGGYILKVVFFVSPVGPELDSLEARCLWPFESDRLTPSRPFPFAFQFRFLVPQDRCHRIGQTKPVTVIRMVAAGTVDEDIYLCGERKKEVNECVLNDSGKKEKDTASTISGETGTGVFCRQCTNALAFGMR